MRIFEATLLMGAFLFLAVPQAFAFTISPLKYSVTIAAGESHDFVVTVKNNSRQPLVYRASVSGLEQDSVGRPIFKQNVDVAENWVKFKDNNITVAPGASADFIFTVSVPPQSPPGGHYLGLNIEQEGESSVNGRLSALLLFQVAGQAREALTLENFSLAKRSVFSPLTHSQLTVRNAGNVTLSLRGRAQIFSSTGRLLADQSVSLGNQLLAATDRVLSVDTVLPNTWLWPGVYRNVVSVRYGLTDQIISASAVWWYCPVWFLVLLAIISLALFIFFSRHKHAPQV